MFGPLRLLAFLLVVALVTTPSLAQIERSNHATEPGERALPGAWVPGYGFPGVSGEVFAIAHTSDRLFVGGSFGSAGNENVSGLGQFSTVDQAWSGAGEGVNGAVHALAVSPEGALYVGGTFTLARRPRSQPHRSVRP